MPSLYIYFCSIVAIAAAFHLPLNLLRSTFSYWPELVRERRLFFYFFFLTNKYKVGAN